MSTKHKISIQFIDYNNNVQIIAPRSSKAETTVRNDAYTRFPPARLALNLLLMPVETVAGDRQYYRLFYLQRLAQPRGKWVPLSPTQRGCL